MKQIGLCCLTLSTVLLTTTPTRAAIHAILENPPNVQAVGGITTLSGWAFSTLPSTAVTLTLRVDGVTTDTPIPCCGPRQDVVTALGAGTPLDTGFGLLFNYGILSAGPHTIGVELSAPGETTQFLDHSVTVVKPANAEFLSEFTLPGSATCSIADNEIVITGAQVTPQGGAPVTTDLRAQFATSSQSLVITEVSGVPALTVFTAHLNGSQETPPVDTAASGTGSLTLNPADNTISCSLTTTGLTGTAAHIHLAEAGVSGPDIVTLSGGPTTWSCPSAPAQALTAEQVSALLAGRLYFDVNSAAHTDGEIRGQIVAPGV
jgi:CHRD domain-containing protein